MIKKSQLRNWWEWEITANQGLGEWMGWQKTQERSVLPFGKPKHRTEQQGGGSLRRLRPLHGFSTTMMRNLKLSITLDEKLLYIGRIDNNITQYFVFRSNISTEEDIWWSAMKFFSIDTNKLTITLLCSRIESFSWR